MSKHISRDELVESLANELNFPESTANKAFNHIVAKILETLAIDKEVRLTGFGAPITIRQKSHSADRVDLDGMKLTTVMKSSAPGHEQRKLQRRNFILDIEVFDRNTGEAVGDLGDITTEGLMIVSENPLEESKSFEFFIRLPEEAEESLEIQFDAKSIRCRETIHESIFITGFVIPEINEETQEKIEHLINEFAV